MDFHPVTELRIEIIMDMNVIIQKFGHHSAAKGRVHCSTMQCSSIEQSKVHYIAVEYSRVQYSCHAYSCSLPPELDVAGLLTTSPRTLITLPSYSPHKPQSSGSIGSIFMTRYFSCFVTLYAHYY